MNSRVISLFNFQGAIGPLPYLLCGVIAFAIKYSIDRITARLLLHQPWLPWQYLNPLGTTGSLLSLSAGDRKFLFVMSLIALPFIWLGISLTVKRLRSLDAPLALVVLFFIPLVSLLFFLLLSVIPARRGGATLDPPAPNRSSPARDAGLAIAISVIVCLSAVWCAAQLSSYGWGLFVALPFCIGLISVVIFTWRAPKGWGECVAVATAACGFAGLALLTVAFEGIICLMMATPIAVTLAVLGASVGYCIQPHTNSLRSSAAPLLMLALYPPLMIGSEAKLAPPVPEFVVRTAIEVNAPPSRVWRNVVSFSELSPPEEWLFRSGIAYPIRAEIHGTGPGAMRYCVFSTGAFVEPITTWDEPRLLEFSVIRNPAPMREWSPYSDLHSPHLEGVLVSHKGHFGLTELSGGRTRLEGVTWYVHSLWPSSYWRVWSDFIIHRIHLRVLNHVKRLSEQPTSP